MQSVFLKLWELPLVLTSCLLICSSCSSQSVLQQVSRVTIIPLRSHVPKCYYIQSSPHLVNGVSFMTLLPRYLVSPDSVQSTTSPPSHSPPSSAPCSPSLGSQNKEMKIKNWECFKKFLIYFWTKSRSNNRYCYENKELRMFLKFPYLFLDK